jgi:peptide/nickel transport system permease protein
MFKFILKRLFYILIVLMLVTGALFVLYRTMPGDPVDIFLPPEIAMTMRPEEVIAIRESIIADFGLDRPLAVQYFLWLGGMFRGEFGYSITTRQPVLDVVRGPMLNTVVINIMNLFLVFSVTIPVGIYCAVKRGKMFDHAALSFSMFGLSIPNFIFGLLLMIIFSVFLGILPISGMRSSLPVGEPGSIPYLMDRLRYMILPLMTLFLTSLAGLIRMVRSAMIDALSMDFVRTARAKGLGEKAVIYSHAFRNALIPIITIMTGWFIGIFSGSLVIEQTFGWQGMGWLMLTALTNRDMAVLMAMGVFYALISYVGLLVMEIAYVIADPRIRLE